MNSNVILLAEAPKYGLPNASVEQPFAQVEWIFKQRLSRVPSKSGKKNYLYALNIYLRFLKETEGPTPFVIKERWDSLSLVRFSAWISAQEKAQYGSHTLTGIVSAIRQVMIEAVVLEVSENQDFISVSTPQASRDTDMHDPYSIDELASILEAVKEDLQYTNAVLAGYKPNSVGRDPCVRPEPSLRINPQNYAEHGYGWNCEANLRWYFENRMNCRAMSRTDDEAIHHTGFFSGAQRYHGGYMAVYKRWGVTPHIDRNIILPLIIQLSYLTGLNPSSLMGLKVDCLSVHPLTGTPVLRYLKLRSKGEKELLVDLLNEEAPENGDNYQDAEMPLKREHAVLIQRVIEKILRLTGFVREHSDFPPHLQNFLFVYQSSGNNCHGEFKSISLSIMNQWCREMAERHNLKTSSGEPLSLSLVRFRPTRLTEMAAKGKDFFEIQHAAGHKSIKTTLTYIEERTLDSIAEREVTNALERIWENYGEFNSPEPITHQPGPLVPFKGLISDCKNVFDPPRSVRLAADFIEGQACTRFNMCLLCKNIVLMKEHLPPLAHYRNQIRVAMTNTGVDLPHVAFYEKSLAILDHIFDPEVSEFSEEELDEGVAAAELLNVVIDPLVYSGGDE